ncbi:MAG: cytochrome P460 family protein [Casimicrobiaceae bacterium]
MTARSCHPRPSGAALARCARYVAALAIGLIAGPVLGGAERVAYPANYQTTFVNYNQIERPDRKPAQVRFMYATRDAAAAARAEEPVPDGAILIMEDRAVKLDTDGQPLRDADGRFIASDKVLNVFVQQKSRGWGEAYPAEKRNGDWEYAWFNADGSRRENAKFDGCFACHQSRAGRDFTFTFVKWVKDGKP